ncbi:hypothetical protein A2Z33_02595 [Candidatus Gottesmanbacteria bacterium RBG_16_52_11]|uniref:Uncharacterized protein n=1 Tax=Candidatus Gottesmanbacteria bacterium RBG_16_52_11 TaxID=1798374 RepID=A0A1F5YMS0_9BACT|nr:MAG: hypothetical protein A2Z33_02595 [Candidatus Gottesmanbacteria bacterium RBG_16_52_11]
MVSDNSLPKRHSCLKYIFIFLLVFIVYNAIIIVSSLITRDFLLNLWIRYAIAGVIAGFIIALFVAFEVKDDDEN